MTRIDRAAPGEQSLGRLVASVVEYAIFSLDPIGAVQTCNIGALRINGFSGPEVVGQHFSIFYPPEDRQQGIPDRDLAHAADHGYLTGEGWRIRKDGSQYWASSVLTAGLDHDGELYGFLTLIHDESARKIADATRQQLEVVSERDRIALHLADTAVRGIYSASLALDSALATNSNPHVAQRIREAATALDHSLQQLRDTVAGLAVPDEEHADI